MGKLFELLDGKKSYIVALIVAVLAVLVAFGIAVPPWVYQILLAFGIVAGKSALKKAE